MEFSIMKRAEKFLRKQGKKYGKAAAVVLAAAVAVATVAALSMPARTLEKETYCGLEEHTHTQECYEKVLTCTKGTDGEAALECTLHQHTKDCYKDKDTKKELICGYADYAVHQHDKNCYIDGKLVCKLKELKEHKHTDKCYKTEKTLVCGKEESEGHTHSDSCYKEKKELTCGKEESEGHKHSDECYDEEGNLICGKEESEGHKHSDDCYKVTKELTCGKEESEGHKHSDECYETKKVLKCDKPEIILHQHTQECFKKNPDKNHKHTDECKNADGVYVCGGLKCDKIDVRKHQHSDDEIVKPDASHEHTDECYEEQLVCGKEEHVHTDECYVEPEEKEAEETEAHVMTAEGDGYTVTVTYGDDAEIPENAELTVKEFEEGSEEYAKRYEELTESINAIDEEPDAETGDAEETTEKKLSSLRLFDVAFMADGEEIEPKASVDVKFAFDGEDSLDDSSVVHFGTEKTELLSGDSLKKETSEDGKPTLGFSVDSFSNFGVYETTGEEPENILNNNVKRISATGEGDREYEFEHKKQIDYLGDGDTNPDTDLKGDTMYRLYLDMVGKAEPMNLLFVVDRSNSMTGKLNSGERRDEAVYNLLKGQDGLINEFLTRNQGKGSSEKSYVAMTWFGGKYPGYDKESTYYKGSNAGLTRVQSGEDVQTNMLGSGQRRYTEDSGLVFNWTDNLNGASFQYLPNLYTQTTGNVAALGRFDYGDRLGHVMEGTNYCSGLMYASHMLHSLPTEAQKHETIVIFISDGVPTYFYQADDFDANTTNKTVTRYGEAIEKKAAACKDGLHSWDNTGSLYSGTKGYGFYSATENFFNAFKNANTNMRLYTVGIGDQLSSYNVKSAYGDNKKNWMETSCSRREVLDYMAEKGSNTKMYSANDASALRKAIREIVFPDNVVIQDTLSKYVDFYDADPDVKVTATENNGSKKVQVLWEGCNDGTAKNNTIGGKAVVQSVTQSGKEVKVTFNPDYALSPDYTYTLSFNVKVTKDAFDEYAETGYNSTGDSDTDYGDNKTSSGQPGFRSNDRATVKYKVDGKDREDDYEHPVVQVWKSQLELQKKNSVDEVLEGVEFTLTGPGNETKTYKTGADGKLVIPASDLVTGSYVLKESKALPGYTAISRGIEFDVKEGRIIPKSLKDEDNYEQGIGVWKWSGEPGGTDTSSERDTEYTCTLDVTNALGTVLPETGGPGTILYTTAGLILVLAAGFICIIRMKRRKMPVAKNN